MDKLLILKKIKEYYNLNSDADFARYLDIPVQNVYSWTKRGAYNAKTLLSKCPDINPVWLLTGEGDMLKSSDTPEQEPHRDPRDVEIIELLRFKIKSLEDEINKLKR